MSDINKFVSGRGLEASAFMQTMLDDPDSSAARGTIGSQATITGAATTITTANLTASKAVVSDASGKVSTSAASATEIGYLAGTTSSIQTQLNGKQASLGFTAENTAKKDVANGYAGLDASGKLNPAQLPAIAVTDTFVCADQTAMLALTAEVGDLAVRTDLNKSFILKTAGASTLANWQELLTPTDLVSSVNGATGVVTITTITGNAGTATKLATGRTIAATGDATGTSAAFDGSGNASIPLTLANSGVTAGTYPKVTVDAKGRVTVGTTLAAGDIPALDWSKITTGKPTTLAGYGITDAAASSHVGAGGTAHADVTTTTDGFMIAADKVKLDGIATGANNYVHPNSGVTAGTYTSMTVNAAGHITAATNPTTLAGYGITDALGISANAVSASKLATARTISLTGDVTGSVSFDGNANVSITTTYKNSGVTAGTYKSVTVDAKGNITAGTNPTTLAGYGITDAAASSHGHDGSYYRVTYSLADFNSALTEGLWYFASGATIANAPVGGGIYGRLKVYVSDGGTHNNTSNWIWQEYMDTGGNRYVRNKVNSGAWTGWVKDYNGNTPPTAAEVGALPTGSYRPRADSLNNSGGAIAVWSGNLNTLTAGTCVLAEKATSSNYPSTGSYAYIETKSIYSNALEQWSTPYDGGGEIYMRNYSVNSASWSSWRRIYDSFSTIITAVGVGNDYASGAFEARGNGTGNTVYPTYGFHQPGLYAASMQLRDANTFYLFKQGAGAYADLVINVMNAADVYIRSDKRLKSNFEPITNPLSKVHALNGWIYDKQAGLGSEEVTREVGVLADDVQTQLPEACRELGEDRLKTISPSALTALLIEAVKEVDLKADGKIEELCNRMANIERLLVELTGKPV